MKRVLVYGMTDNNGGVESYLMNYFREFDREKLIFDFVTDDPTIAYEEEIKKLGGRIFYIPSRRGNLKEHMKQFRNIVRANGYKLVYYNVLSASTAFSVIAPKFLKGVKIIVHSHNGSVDKMRNHLMLRPVLNWATDKRLACSVDAAKFMFGEKYAKDTIVIKNAINSEKFRYRADVGAEVRKEFGLENNFVVGSIGRMCFQKNTLFLLDIFNEIHKKDPSAKLLLVGEGEDRPLVEAKIEELGIGEHVILTGMRSDVDRLLQAMDVFLFPSRFEGLPVVLIEVQASGLPCVVSKDVIPEVVKISENLEFVKLDKTAEEWADIVIEKKKIQRTDDLEKIRKAGYDIKTQASELQELFEKM